MRLFSVKSPEPSNELFVIPAKAGIQLSGRVSAALNWIPAFAGLTVFRTLRHVPNQVKSGFSPSKSCASSYLNYSKNFLFNCIQQPQFQVTRLLPESVSGPSGPRWSRRIGVEIQPGRQPALTID